MTEDLAPQVEEQIELPIADKPAEPPSLRESLGKALEESKETPEVKAERKERQRADDGKFVKGAAQPVKETKPAQEPKQQAANPPVAAAPVTQTPEIKVPDRYPASVKAKWSQLPPDVQADLAKSADDFHKELTRHDEERVLARQFKEVVAPYIAQMRAEGANPIQATQALYDTAYRLRTGTPQQKGQLLWETARAFGADMSQGFTQQAQAPFNPQLHQMTQEVQTLKAQIEQQNTLRKQQEDAGVQSQIDTFKADPKNVHFETVKAHMAALLSGGAAKDLADAYDQAVYANPQTRASLLTQATQSEQEKRVADQKAKAEAAKKAGSSIKGSPGMAATRDPKVQSADLNSAIRSAFAEHSGRA